jgi:hypothetical protein
MVYGKLRNRIFLILMHKYVAFYRYFCIFCFYNNQ